MNLMRLLIAGLLLPAICDAGLPVKVAVNADGTVTTEYRDGSKPLDPPGSCPSGWTCEEMGDAVCEFDEIDSDTFEIVATGGTNDEGNTCFIYKTAATDSDLHLEALIPASSSWNPTNPENFAGAGVKIVDDTGYESHTWWPFVGRARFKTDAGGAGERDKVGAAGTSLPYRVGYEYDDSETEETGWESGDAWTTDFPIDTPVTKSLTFPVKYGVFVTSHDTNNSLTIQVDDIDANTTLSFSDGGTPEDPGEREGIVWTVDAESGAIQERFTTSDGAFLRTMAGTVNGTCTWISTGAGGGALASNHHVRAATSWNGINPVDGNNLFVVRLEKNCDYSATNDKARNAINLSGLRDSPGVAPYEEGIWFGWAMYPFTWDQETAITNGDVPIFEISTTDGKSAVTMALDDGGWNFRIKSQTCTGCTNLPSPEAEQTLQATVDFSTLFDQWNYWVVYVVMDNDSNGRLKIWLNETNIVDYSGAIGPNPNANESIYMQWEIYKYSWNRRPTSVDPPMTWLLDEARVGREASGAGYQDVHPTQTACTDNC